MSLYRLQGKAEKRRGIFYEFDSAEEPLGVGGMGKVYKGWCVDENTHSRKLVAVKFMFDELQWQAPQTIERARREASIQIKHENLVEMLGFIETEEKNVIGEVQKHYHVVSELLEGIMLDDLLQGRIVDRTGRIMPFAQKLYNDYQRDVNHFAIYIIRSVLSGLMALHDAGYIHRDIDPTNIMITSDGHVKLIDFGIAKQLRSLTSHDKSLSQMLVHLLESQSMLHPNSFLEISAIKTRQQISTLLVSCCFNVSLATPLLRAISRLCFTCRYIRSHLFISSKISIFAKSLQRL